MGGAGSRTPGTETTRRFCITSIRLVGTRRTKASFAASSTSSTGNGSIVAAGTDPIEIRIETLDSFAEVWEAPVALVKIDTEGYEPEVLRGATRLIDQHRPVLYLEMGGDYVESTRESIAILADAGYGVEHVRSIDWTRVGSGSDYFFLPRR
jgi:hypothetical protein